MLIGVVWPGAPLSHFDPFIETTKHNNNKPRISIASHDIGITGNNTN